MNLDLQTVDDFAIDPFDLPDTALNEIPLEAYQFNIELDLVGDFSNIVDKEMNNIWLKDLVNAFRYREGWMSSKVECLVSVHISAF